MWVIPDVDIVAAISLLEGRSRFRYRRRVFRSTMDSSPESGNLPTRQGLLPHTPWTMLIRSREGDTVAHEALGMVLGLYWRPIRICIEKRGFRAHDAEDLTQEFLSGLVRRGNLDSVDREKGRLRSYLLTALNHFLANVRRDRSTQRRGGGAVHYSMDASGEDGGTWQEPTDSSAPDRDFDREWALTLLENVMGELRAEFELQGKVKIFDVLSPALSLGESSTDAATMALDLGMSAGATRVALHRLRLRYRNLLYRHVAATVGSEEEIEDEIRGLVSILRG